VVFYIKDITELKKAHAKLEETIEAQQRAIVAAENAKSMRRTSSMPCL